MTDSIECNLAGNALDYLLLAGEMAKQDTPRMLKHAVATLADGVELLLKARLEVYDWSLLFKNVDNADRTKFESGDFQSVTFVQTIKRLRGICDVDIDAKILGTLNALRVLRNKIRHFAVTIDKAEVVSLIAKAYGFAIDFAAEHLEEHLDPAARTDFDQLRRLLGEFANFVNDRLVAIKDKLTEQGRYVEHAECPRCLQETLYSDAGEASCAFCGYRASGEEAASEWLWHHYGRQRPKDMQIMMDDLGLGACPECGADATIPLDEGEGCHCLSCGQTSNLSECCRCNTPCYDGLCDYCRQLMEKDD